MKLPQEMIDEMVSHSRADAPDECCGLIATDGGVPVRLFRAINADASPLRFTIDSADQYRIIKEIDENGWQLAAIYHSHTRSAAYPSQTDINFASAWPGVVWLIVSLERADEPSVRAFTIEGADVAEIELEIAI